MCWSTVSITIKNYFLLRWYCADDVTRPLNQFSWETYVYYKITTKSSEEKSFSELHVICFNLNTPSMISAFVFT